MKGVFALLVAFLAQPFMPSPAAAQRVTVDGTVSMAGGGADLVVYLVPEKPVEPAAPRTSPLVDQVRLRFVPSVLAVSPGTRVEFRNSDPVLHNVFSPEGPGPGFDLGTYPKTESRAYTFTQLGSHVILCHVHPEMYAYVVVVPTPYHGVANQDGSFRIESVRPGHYTLNVMQRRQNRFSRAITLDGGGPVRIELDLTTGEMEIHGGAP